MKIQCTCCQPNAFIEAKNFDKHIAEVHSEVYAERAMNAIDKASKRVDYIYTHFPEAINNNGILLQKYFRVFPIYTIRYIYEPQNKRVGIEAETWSDFVYAMKHSETVTRLGRAWRMKHSVVDSGPKPLERDYEFNWSKAHWAVNKEGV